MRFMKLLCVLIGLMLSQVALSYDRHNQNPIVTMVDGDISYGQQMHCKAYLHKSNDDTKKRHGAERTLLFFQLGTGVYTNFFHQPSGNADYELSIDKPGIMPDMVSGQADKFIVDEKVYGLYTMNSLITCAQNALAWADNYLGKDPKQIILQGHSEGSFVMTNVAYNIFSDSRKKRLKNEIKALFLSGIALDNMADVLKKQSSQAEFEQILHAHKMKDGDYLYKNLQVGWGWVDNVLNTNQSVATVLDSFAKSKQGRALPIEFFQGIFDKEVSAESVYNFEKKNNAEPENNRLNLHARYYNSTHNLNLTTVSDIQLLQDYYFQRSHK